MADSSDYNIITFGPEGETKRRMELVDMIRHCPVPDEELLMNLGLFLTPQTLSRILFMDFLYRQILDVQGVVMEFGCRWGQNTSLFSAMRGIYEPFNRLRRVIAFDTFSGFPSVRPEDGEQVRPGAYATTAGYERYLDRVLMHQERESPLDHLRKYEIVKGDVRETVPRYLDDHQETVIALAYFDLDLYEPTVACLEAIKDRITRGTILGFDEANDQSTPGETIAIREALGLSRYSLKRYRYNARTSYVVIE